MVKIKAFKGLYPNPDLIEEVVVSLENTSLEQAKKDRQKCSNSFFNLLVPEVSHQSPGASKKEASFKQIHKNLNEFLDKNIYLEEDNESIYIYQIEWDKQVALGIWCVTSVDSYLDKSIKVHELTTQKREEQLIEYLKNTGLDANPVLLIHEPVSELSRFIEQTTSRSPDIKFTKSRISHTIWRLTAPDELEFLQSTFLAIEKVYIADGHHKASSAVRYACSEETKAGEHVADERRFFNTIFMDSTQIKIHSFHRLVKSTSNVTSSSLLSKLRGSFRIEALTGISSFVPTSTNTFGLYTNGKWYKLEYLGGQKESDPVKKLNVSILQEEILAPYLLIRDPRKDERISFAPKDNSLEELKEKVDKGESDYLFTVFPISINQVMEVADAEKVMPPKSTWFEPKFLTGLLIHKVE
jgi:uncharacterized protein (DUF1015 family)